MGKKSPAAALRLQAEGARSLFASQLWLEKAGVVLRHSAQAVASTGDCAARNARSGRLGAQSRQHLQRQGHLGSAARSRRSPSRRIEGKLREEFPGPGGLTAGCFTPCLGFNDESFQ